MKALCRFCLSVSNDETYNFTEDGDIYSRIRTCFPLQIRFNILFPDQLCKQCVEEIDRVEQFYIKVKQNEEILQAHLYNNSLPKFYLQIIGDIPIKNESFNEPSIEDSNITIEPFNSIDNKDIIVSDDVKKDEKINETTVKIEYEENFDRDFTSDDDVALSSSKTTDKHIPKLKTNNTKTKKKKNGTDNIEKCTEENISKENSISEDLFRCLTCKKLCSDHDNLRNHYNKKHLVKKNKVDVTKYKEFNCDGKLNFKCEICDKVCGTRKKMHVHLSNHDTDRPFLCKLCSRTFRKVTEIIRHGRVHSGIRLYCSHKCGFSTAYPGHLRVHERKHQSEYKPKYTCEKCNKTFDVKTWYEQHQNIHLGLRPFVCDLCPQAFHMNKYLQLHKSSAHPELISTGRLVCLHCDKKCDSVISLAVHMEEHGIENKKGHLCHFCGKVITTRSKLKEHQRMHMGIKPYTCSICNKSYAKSSTLKEHTVHIHGGEKVHICHCGKRYAQRSTLQRHVNTHHPESSSKNEQ